MPCVALHVIPAIGTEEPVKHLAEGGISIYASSGGKVEMVQKVLYKMIERTDVLIVDAAPQLLYRPVPHLVLVHPHLLHLHLA